MSESVGGKDFSCFGLRYKHLARESCLPDEFYYINCLGVSNVLESEMIKTAWLGVVLDCIDS